MKIGLVLAQPPSYSETFFNSKIKGLQAHGFEVILFCQNNSVGYSSCPVKIFPSKKRNPIIFIFSFLRVFISLIPYFNRILKWYRLEKEGGLTKFLSKVYFNAPLLKAELDWVHYGFGTMALGRETLAKVIGAKMAVSFRGYDINVYPKKNIDCYEKLWRNADKIHSISKYLVKEANTLGLNKNALVKIITPAVNMQKLDQKKIVNTKQKISIVTVARLSWIKGIDFIIETASYLKARGLDFEWTVIGDGENKDKERYYYHIFELGLQKEVFLVGRKSHELTLNLVSEASYYVQTSYSEGFCNGVLEAQALGKLCFAFQTGALAENIIHEKTGWLIEPFDTNKLAEKIVEVVGLPTARKQEISLAAIKRVRENFNIEQQQQEFVNFYKN